MNEVIRSN